MRCFYDLLLQLYPIEYRALFGEEIRIVLREAAEDKLKQGTAAFVVFVLREMLGLLAGLGAEWMAKFTTFNGYMSGAQLTGRKAAISGAAIESERRIQLLYRHIEHAIAHHDFEGARFYSIENSKERAKLEKLRAESSIIDHSTSSTPEDV